MPLPHVRRGETLQARERDAAPPHPAERRASDAPVMHGDCCIAASNATDPSTGCFRRLPVSRILRPSAVWAAVFGLTMRFRFGGLCRETPPIAVAVMHR
jgi:hypothetical protein